jgi:hypothetical protein
MTHKFVSSNVTGKENSSQNIKKYYLNINNTYRYTNIQQGGTVKGITKTVYMPNENLNYVALEN